MTIPLRMYFNLELTVILRYEPYKTLLYNQSKNELLYIV